MHDSLPKGDIEELLGKVPSYTPSSLPKDQFLELSKDENHPFHLVVIAGQECPTPSGIPKGLSASFKWHDKDKDKERDRDKEKVGRANDKDAERSKLRKERDSTKRKKEEETGQEHNVHSWTAMCEDWLCNGGSFSNRSATPSVADVSAPKPLARRTPSKEPKKGPYQLLIKERLMGIYMAIYVHRDMRALVKGSSKSAVTAGLIGGRVGNKGGVGISLNLDGTSLLFLNAHLAAHGGKNHHRLANMCKINAELAVDPYLECKDPRTKSEDITDQFDYTFICGDLNFRLDITRQHADWLIARKDYAQALHFDQLKQLIKSGTAFIGFEEGIINFPPTFKYDVSRTLKNSKHNISGRSQSPQAETPVTPVYLSQDDLARSTTGQDRDEDVVSIASTASHSTSSYSVAEQSEGSDFAAMPVVPIGKDSSTPMPRAHQKWLSRLSVRFASSKLSFEGAIIKKVHRRSLEEPSKSDESKPLLNLRHHSLDGSNAQSQQPPAVSINSTKTTLNSEGWSSDKGVYDSSNKQRVPSWCDRILWKSTVRSVIEDRELQDYLSSQPKSSFINNLRKVVRRKPRPSCRDRLPSSSARTVKETDTTSESMPTSPANALNHSRSHENFQPLRAADSRIARQKSESYIKSTTTKPAERRASEHPSPKRTTSRSFWDLLPSFLSPPHSPATADLIPAEFRQPRKGDVVCLSYGTLDDQGMSKLGGRSDHRPVIGSYAVYL
ncbi:hypothetical protein AGABI2DRAFT_218097 [Agaricus bisporus var. bisporus H97]|uniref:hypothetical protein n=1 Tax=Agaricus bisporus var. bisporus (strain H97 / ATCC MYA-4626 / FGSC 10389) TaxID=936046 RepID=UPI00029F67E3|nr:hypothetical protein AGABI2DRAFT_218097 [Agaricus bisporus var. bisporus H97]EKV49055.1 hypothetical protein AGABI2DRAFT_218097 [Agaricus bisporus var. bisporus H97]